MATVPCINCYNFPVALPDAGQSGMILIKTDTL
jgi:hypothetical protein